MGFFIFSWSACDIEKIEYRPTNGSRVFVIKEKDGKKLWGLVHEDNVNSFYIPCEYDSIFSTYGAPYNLKNKHLFIAQRGGKMYAWHYDGKQLLDGKGFTKFVSHYQEHLLHNNSDVGGGLFSECYTDDGIMFISYMRSINSEYRKWFELGPAEALLWTNYNVLIKKDGKWGVLYGEYENEKYRHVKIPCVYDAIICVSDVYFWVRKDDKWMTIDNKGELISKPKYLLDKYLNLPSLTFEEVSGEYRNELYRKTSVQEAAYIILDPWNREYYEW